tara:strand:- start:556 stop:1185 length:630 start_codon:yes stop_codon:yes gene_type:complete
MSKAKWHPAEGEFGIFGDVEEGSVESRAAEAQAGRGLQALEGYREGVEKRRGDISDYYSGQADIQEQEYGLRREGVGLQQERLGLAREQLGGQQSQALSQFLGDAYSFRSQSDVQRATGGLAFSGGQERGVERRRATMSDMMRGREEQFGLQQQGLDISGQELGLQMEGIDLSQAKEYADLMKSRGIEMAGIEDLLYQLETEQISYEGV